MSDIFQLPEFLTMVSYLVLFVLTVWVVANAIHLFSEGGAVKTPRIKKICDKLDRLTRRLRQAVTELKRLRAEERKISRSKSGDPQEREDKLDKVRSCIAKERAWRAEIISKGPGDDIASWFKGEGVDSRVIESASSENSGEGTSYGYSLGIPAMIATPAGAAPTMSGTMEFLRDYSASIEEGGALPLSGLNDALFTTWAGCFLTIVSMVLLAYSRNRGGPQDSKNLEESVALIKEAHGAWKDTVCRARLQTGEEYV